jgi:hypothetical protein
MIGKWTVWENFITFSIDRRIDFLTVKKFNLLQWLLVPVPWIIVCSFLLSKVKWIHLHHWFLIAPAYLLVVPLGLGMILGIVIGGDAVFSKLDKWAENINPRIRAARKKSEEEYFEKQAQARKAELETLELLLCSSGKRIKTIKDLPDNKRTIKLKYQGLKAYVCKPFSR